jgi:hypothetical protein
MAIKGGDVRQVIIDGVEYSPVGGGGGYNPMFHGFQNENLPTGDGRMHTNQNRKLGGFDGLQLSVTTEEFQTLQEVANSGEEVPVQVTVASGSVHSGQLAMEGELTMDGVAGTTEVAMRGPRYEEQ